MGTAAGAGSQSHRATVAERGDASVIQPRLLSASSPRSATCRSARKGLAYYSRRINGWRSKMGAGVAAPSVHPAATEPRATCPHLRLAAKHARALAHRLRLRYERWSYQWEWRRWLPALWRAIGMCETGLRWNFTSGTYEGAFGFYYGSWDAYKPRGAPSAAYLATPRQQYQAALNIASKVGLGAWGCYSNGGYRYHMP